MSSTPRPTLHQIVVNDAREFAVWPSAKPLPRGWLPAGRTGTREELVSHLRSSFAPLVELPPNRTPRG
jgi:MbtH protein